jgi:SpoVK/Ycf46/Vps4 family AAA+-type ATPase
VRRRLVRRLLIPLPDAAARATIVRALLGRHAHALGEADVAMVARESEGYSGADMHALCHEAAMGPVRAIADIREARVDAVRPVSVADFAAALRTVRPSVARADLAAYERWNETYGTMSREAPGVPE